MSCAGRKYANHAQLVQCVGRVNDPTLTLSERSFLNCLAAHSVSGNPHPGNAILMIWCGVRTRQGLNKISDRLRSRGLLELIQEGRGRGEQHANVWRIRLDDDRFPEHPKNHKQPSLFPPLKPQLQSCPFPEEKTATPEAEKPQLGSRKTATGKC